MASLAIKFRKTETAAAPAARPVKTEANPYRLRSLPNEDLYLFTKRIDNSRLVRAADPKARGECWSGIGAMCAVAVVVITTLAPRVASIMAGYQYQSLKQEEARLINERTALQAEEAALLSTERLEQLARDHNMVAPKAGQVIHLNGRTPAVASLRKAAVKTEKAEE